MTDLKALRREMAQKLNDAIACSYELSEVNPLIEAALLQYAEACLGEPSFSMNAAANVYAATSNGVNPMDGVWTAMASQRLKEIK